MSDLIKLKPCPFCGGNPIIIVLEDKGVGVMCRKCFVETLHFTDTYCTVANNEELAIDRAINSWNNREGGATWQ